ncbi:hypothetical protein [Flavihumibacter sp.]|uniref:hypothetical protein n=1 Tax=Flavihumibacter sp. TaxID=1913981 RepID=UPI002FC8B8F1
MFRMKCFSLSIMAFSLLIAGNLNAQSINLNSGNLEAVNVRISFEKMNSKNAVKAIKDSSIKEFDEPTFIKIKNLNFQNGTIEVKVLSKLLKNVPAFARGFIGIAFRINDDNTKYESIYLRPTNARAGDQVRRNHSIQYYSYPDYKFDRLRKESPEKYESYSDMEMGKWITMRIEVKGSVAKLFLGNNTQPSLIVTDLKHGADISGSIGLWVDIGTEGYFSDLKINTEKY